MLRAKAGRPPKGEEKNVGNANIKSSRNDNTYTLARLRRDRPDLAERVERRELTANAAAIEAGFRAKQVQLAKDPHRAAQSIIAARGMSYAEALIGSRFWYADRQPRGHTPHAQESLPNVASHALRCVRSFGSGPGLRIASAFLRSLARLGQREQIAHGETASRVRIGESEPFGEVIPSRTAGSQRDDGTAGF